MDYLHSALTISLIMNAILLFLIGSMDRIKQRRYGARCHKCGYDTRATIGGQCPECGEPLKQTPLPKRELTHCDFCGKDNRETGPHVIGISGTFICANCVELCHGVILKNLESAKGDSKTPASEGN